MLTPCGRRRENLEVFRTNGFDFADDDGGRLQLTGVPFSRNTTFGAADVRELVALLDAGGAAPLALGSAPAAAQQGAVVRPSRCFPNMIACHRVSGCRNRLVPLSIR